MLGNVVFGNFWFSQCWETQFSLFFSLPNFGKRVFSRFCSFPTLGNTPATIFRFSQHWEDCSCILPREFNT